MGFRELNGSSKHRYAAVAGALCAGVSLCTLASSVALESAPALTAIGLAAFGLLLSFLCFAVPWERVGRRTIELAPAVAILAIAVATTTIDPTYGFYLVLVAACIGYMADRPRVIGLHLGLIALALIAPIVLEPEGTRKALACALIFGPGVVAVSALAVYMRRAGDAREAAYREFATDAMSLASRIRDRVGTPGGAPLRAPDWLEAPAPMIPLRNVGIAKVVRAEGSNGSTAHAAPALGRLPMTAIAIAASVVAVVATTVALVRDPGERVVVAKGSPAVARQAAPRTIAARTSASPRGDTRRHRANGGGATTETSLSQPPLALTDPPDSADSGGGGGSSQPSTPAASPPPETTVPVRPQTGEPESQTPPPTPVQQVGPATPVASAVGLAEQTVTPLTPDVRP